MDESADYDVEAASERLKQYAFNGVDQYTFYLKSTVPHDYGNFFMFPTQEAMFAALVEDLYGYNDFEDDSVELIEELVDEIGGIISDASNPKYSSNALMQDINQLLTGWEIQFIGKYETLLHGDGEWEREYRAGFREDQEDESGDGLMPINNDERERFDEYVNQPEWDR